jgi:glycosyltransferase involved in cell wall biosynthesis
LKQKILFFSDWYYPGYKAGGPIKSVTNLSIALSNQFDIYVFTRDRDLNENKSFENIQSNVWVRPFQHNDIKVYYCSNNNLVKNTIDTIVREIQPQSIYLNHLWSVRFVLQPLFLCITTFKNINIILCPRGALFASALHYKNTFIKKRILLGVMKFYNVEKKINFHATTNQEKNTITKYLKNAKVTIANNLPDLIQQPLQIIEKKPNEISIVFIARIVEIKNLLLLLQAIQKLKGNVQLTIAGPIEDNNYWESCKNIISTLPSNIQVNYIGEILPNQVAKLIEQNHLYCLPTKGENFGHSIFEAFMVGRPVLISNKTPWDNLYEKKAGWDVDISNTNALSTSIKEAMEWDQDNFAIFCNGSWKVANEYINNPNLVTPYYELFNL